MLATTYLTQGQKIMTASQIFATLCVILLATSCYRMPPPEHCSATPMTNNRGQTECAREKKSVFVEEDSNELCDYVCDCIVDAVTPNPDR